MTEKEFTAASHRLTLLHQGALGPYGTEQGQREATIEACRIAQALGAEIDRLNAKLSQNRCNAGHETLPLFLWDCPECHNETRRKLEAMRKTLEWIVGPGPAKYEETDGTMGQLAFDSVVSHARLALKEGAR